MRDETALGWRVAAGWLVRARTTYETGGSQGGDETDMDVPDRDDTYPPDYDGEQHADCPVDTWMNHCNGSAGYAPQQ